MSNFFDCSCDIIVVKTMYRIENLKFKNKNKFKWDDLEAELKFFVGDMVVVEMYKKEIFFDKHTIDEMSHSKYNFSLKGKMKLIKANACIYIKELLRDATNERYAKDFEGKHGNLAINGFYKYDVQFEYPKKDKNGEIVDYTQYGATVIARCASNKKLYAYDIINFKKKEISDPHRIPKV